MLIEKKFYKKMFDLNSSEFQERTIFNNGDAGLVKDVEISVETKEPGSNQPDYKLIAKDSLGEVNAGFYIPTPAPNRTDEQNQKSASLQVGRVVHIARAVMGADYQFPEYNGIAEIYKGLFGLIAEHSKGKKFNVYTTYGTLDRPSKYLGLRYFNFIESADTTNTKLVPNKKDLLQRLEQDNDSSDDDTITNSTDTNLMTQPLDSQFKM